LHLLSHPGLHFLILSDGTLRSQSALVQGGFLGRMSHAQVTILGTGMDPEKMADHLQDARKEVGSGMATLDVEASPLPFNKAITKITEEHPFDLAILGWRPTAGLQQPEQLLQTGEQHLYLATQPTAQLRKALILLASGEPGKDNVLFAGRFLRHFGAEATLLTVLPDGKTSDYESVRVERFLKDGRNSLARFGVPADIHIRQGEVLDSIQTEMDTGEYDLVILGAPLPGRTGEFELEGVIKSILTTIEDCSFLIVRSHQLQRMQDNFRRTS
jgi:nucleotide-binding universal stress UspA family protein